LIAENSMSASAAVSVSELLGLRRNPARPGTALGLMGEVERGLPLSALDRIAQAVAPGDSSFAHRLVPRATLARRRAHGSARLTPEESARVARLASVWAFAIEVCRSDEEARGFLSRPHPELGMRRPIDVVLASELGRPLVEAILGRIKYGTGL
jgi:putative toxin-antitoxin system antitoxin component (TIGR02293 family)